MTGAAIVGDNYFLTSHHNTQKLAGEKLSTGALLASPKLKLSSNAQEVLSSYEGRW